MSDRKLYWFSGSPWCWRPLAVLEEKGLSYESNRVPRTTGEHKSGHLLKLNPRGQLPIFIDGDAAVNDSMAIMQYLEATYPSVPLLPNGKAELALACQRLHETTALYEALQPPLHAKMFDKVNTYEEKAKYQDGIEDTLKQMDFFEGYLSDGRSFLIGEMFTLADVCLAVFLFVSQQFGARFEKHPNLKKYAERLQERPCFKDTWPAEWHESQGKEWLADL